ncbi:MAG: MgtC/SapB family protein [Vicinamibacteria bacterium]|nr:MgtC/SapB family protein [Vicinamibacteria bacterium]
METPIGGAVISILIGLLMGLEREHSQRPDERLFAGIRTFPILVLCGFVSARAAEHGVPWALPVTLIGIAAIAVAAYLRTAATHVGATTEVTVVLAPLLGALVAWGEVTLAAAVAVVVTLLLSLKGVLHSVAGAITEEEIIAILKFGIVAVILLPLLPTQALDPLGAIIPRRIGMVVVLLSAVSLVGYLLVRLLGGRTGWALAGLLGGLVSSTAVTLSLSGKARETKGLARTLGTGIILASTILYLRAGVVIGLFDTELAVRLLPRFALLLAVGVIGAASAWRQQENAPTEGVQVHNPAELGRAFVLGGVFALVMIVARAAQAQFGASGLWLTGFLGGLADVDSVAVVAAELRRQGLATLYDASGSFLLATLANLLVKGGLALAIGGRSLARWVWPTFAALALTTGALLFSL